MVCSCGGRYPDSDEFCPFCNSRNAEYTIPAQSQKENEPEPNFSAHNFVQCKNCSRNIPASADKCPICGAFPSLQDEQQQYQEQLANSCANIAIVCGILGLLVAGPIFGSIAIFQGLKARRLGFIGGRATNAVILGILAIVFWLLIMFLFFFLVPRFAPDLLPDLYQLFGL